ncbi:Conserved hypothetical protein [gamma proteobacterium HdN1]|nr:Conserved hypothetical protein [gamma proteobacterium HdN1]
MNDAVFVLIGGLVGFCVGLTGVGGGSLMTPLLLMLGIPAQTAIGTDLLYAAVTKAGGALVHQKKHNINWRVVWTLAAGSIPLSFATVLALKYWFSDVDEYKGVLTAALGFMLLLTGFSLVFKRRLKNIQHINVRYQRMCVWLGNHSTSMTLVMGMLLGILVTLSSVGAGAFGAMILLMLYPRFATIGIIGTDVAHAVLLTLVAGIGHMTMGHVDMHLLVLLLIGSLPAIVVGTHLSSSMPERVIQPVLGCTLMALSFKFMLA